MMELKTLLFEKTAAALAALQTEKERWPGEEHELTRRTFCALYELVEEAGLEDEYYAWKEARV